MNTLGNLEIQLLLNTQGFATGSKKALQMLNTLAKAGEKLGVFKKMNLKQAIGEIDKLNASNKKLQTSIGRTSKAEKQLSSASTKAATQIRSQSTATVSLSKNSLTLSDRLGKVGLGLLAVREFSAIASSSFTGFIESFKTVDMVYQRYLSSSRELDAASKLTGVSLDALKDISEDTKKKFELTKIQANKFTIELSKLGKKAGDTTKTADAIEKLLNIGAGQGLTTQQTLDAIRQAVLGIDEGTDKLFQKNPSVIYKEYADQIGTSVGKMDDQQKAMAMINEVMVSGTKLQGKYNEFLESGAGKQEFFKNQIEETRAKIGEQLQPVMLRILSTLSDLLEIFNKLSPSQQKWVFIIGVSTVALGKLTTAILVSKAALTGFGTASGKAATGMKGLGATMGTVIGIAASLGTALALLDNRMQKISGYSINPANMLRYDFPVSGRGDLAYDKAMDFIKKRRELDALNKTGVTSNVIKGITGDIMQQKKYAEENAGLLNLMKDLEKDIDETKKSTGKSSSKQLDTEKQILSLLEQEKKKLDELKEKYDANADSQQAQFEIMKDIEKVQERLNALQGIHIKVQDIDIENLDIALKKLIQIKDLSLTPEQETARMLQLEEILKANRQQEREDILNSEEFGAAQLTFSSLANTFRSEFSTVISDLFGDSGFMAKLMTSLLSNIADKFAQFFINTALSSAFPGAGIITSLFGGGGASGGGGGAMPSGMPSGAGGFGGGDNLSLTSGMPNIAPILNTTVTQPPIILNIKSTVPMHEFMIEGMKTHNIYINEEKVK